MKRKIALLITMIFAVAVLPLSFVAYKEFYVKPFLASQPPFLRPYVDYKPFFSTLYGIATIAMWTVLILWFDAKEVVYLVLLIALFPFLFLASWLAIIKFTKLEVLE